MDFDATSIHSLSASHYQYFLLAKVKVVGFDHGTLKHSKANWPTCLNF